MGETAVVQQGLRDALVAVVGDRHVPDRPRPHRVVRDGLDRAVHGPQRRVVRPAGPESWAASCAPAAPRRAAARAAGRQHRPGRWGDTAGRRRRREPGPVHAARRARPLAGADHRGRRVHARPGAAGVRGTGLDLGVDLAARDSATIGGMVATNAGGSRVVAYGSMRAAGRRPARRCSPTARSSTGSERLRKDNTGYDLVGLLAGSEGTLAVITAVRLRLVRPPARTVALVGCASRGRRRQRILGRVGAGRHAGAAEFLLGGRARPGVRAPRGAAAASASGPRCVLLLEVGADAGRDGRARTGRCGTRHGRWRWPSTIRRPGPAVAVPGVAHRGARRRRRPVKLDVAVPPGRLDALVATDPRDRGACRRTGAARPTSSATSPRPTCTSTSSARRTAARRSTDAVLRLRRRARRQHQRRARDRAGQGPVASARPVERRDRAAAGGQAGLGPRSAAGSRGAGGRAG